MSRTTLKPATTYGAVVGCVLSEMRGRAGLTQTQLAAEMGLTQSAWSRIECGSNTISVDQIREAARLLGFAPDGILAAAERAVMELGRRGVRVETAKPAALHERFVLVASASVSGAAMAAVAAVAPAR